MNENTLIWIAVAATVIILLPFERAVAKSLLDDIAKKRRAARARRY